MTLRHEPNLQVIFTLEAPSLQSLTFLFILITFITYISLEIAYLPNLLVQYIAHFCAIALICIPHFHNQNSNYCQLTSLRVQVYSSYVFARKYFFNQKIIKNPNLNVGGTHCVRNQWVHPSISLC